MKWEHRCDIEWLRERQRYLTASDIKSLIPVTRTGRKRDVTDLDYLKVLSGKMTDITEEDCMSYGAAARGHILEPYAIEAFNATLEDQKIDERFFWWDDEIVAQPGRAIAFSPDAMNIPPNRNPEAVSAIAEVKSYEASKHLSVAYSMKDEIEERWQIATAMALLPQIDHAYLVLFNPKVRFRKLFAVRFDRAELEDEIKIILDIEQRWRDFRESGPLTKTSPNLAIYSHFGKSEETIMSEVEQRQRLNP